MQKGEMKELSDDFLLTFLTVNWSYQVELKSLFSLLEILSKNCMYLWRQINVLPKTIQSVNNFVSLLYYNFVWETSETGTFIFTVVSLLFQ